ncbi:MAG: ankyrin repeat domain-containing protein [Planctomycetota bacterium]
MRLSPPCSRRFVILIATATGLGSSLVLIGCGESEGAVPIEAATHTAPDTSFAAAILKGDDHAVHAHVVAGTPVNSTNATGDSPLHIAAALGRVYAAEVLIGAGAELEPLNGSGVTPLFNAAFFCHAEVLQRLIDAGADTSVTDQNGLTIRQIMELPWTEMRPIYEMVYKSLGLPFDEQRIRDARPGIAEMLR